VLSFVIAPSSPGDSMRSCVVRTVKRALRAAVADGSVRLQGAPSAVRGFASWFA